MKKPAIDSTVTALALFSLLLCSAHGQVTPITGDLNVSGGLGVNGSIYAGKDIMIATSTPNVFTRVGSGGGSLYSNSAFGIGVLNSNTTGTANIALGGYALTANTTGGHNVVIGWDSNSTGSIGSYNVAVGNFALKKNLANQNTAVGYTALTSNTTGYNNTASGNYSMYNNQTAIRNTAYGAGSLANNNWNNALPADNNTAVGCVSLGQKTTGRNNAALGAFSGYYKTDGTALTTTNDSVYLGADSKGVENETCATTIGTRAKSGGTNSITLGADATGAANAITIGKGTTGEANTVTIGGSTITKTKLAGNVDVQGTITCAPGGNIPMFTGN